MRSSRSLIFVLAVLVASCSSSPTTPTTSTASFSPSISFTGGDSFAVGQTSQLTATERVSSATTQDVTTTAAWQSSNPGVATVSASGIVSARSIGSTIVTASSQGVVGSLVVSVVVNTVTAVLVVGPASLPVGLTSDLTASVSTEGGMQVVTSGIVWQSSNPGVLSISSTGTVTAISVGTSTITATYAGATGTLAVAVVSPTVTSIVFYGMTSVSRGSTAQLTASALLADGSAQVVTNVAVWQSLNTDLATVSSTGLVTALSTVGTATITATYLGATGSVGIVIN